MRLTNLPRMEICIPFEQSLEQSPIPNHVRDFHKTCQVIRGTHTPKQVNKKANTTSSQSENQPHPRPSTISFWYKCLCTGSAQATPEGSPCSAPPTTPLHLPSHLQALCPSPALLSLSHSANLQGTLLTVLEDHREGRKMDESDVPGTATRS